MKKFEKGFLVGAATAAHQVEGNNVNSDCWAMEHMEHTSFVEPSLDAVDHYNRYEEDIRLMKEAGLNAYRFSIEWARIQPEENRFAEEELEHYRKVIRCCKENGLEPVVTLHHFSSPRWFIGKGGWEAETVPEDFARYVRYVCERLGEEFHYVCTINEANMGVQVAAVAKRYMMQMMAKMKQAQAGAAASGGLGQAAAASAKNGEAASAQPGGGASADGSVQMGINLEKMMAGQQEAAEENRKVFGVAKVENFTSPRTERGDQLVMEAHRAARAVIRELCPRAKVGLTLSLHDLQAQPGGEENAVREWEEEFLHYLPAIVEDDFLGVQNYTRTRIDASGQMPNPEGAELTQMEYEYYPQALEHVIRKVAEKFQGVLMVTENGVAVSDDARRVEFIRRATEGVQNCIADGIPVKGYFYWSLMDNFEWQKGYGMTFGLIAVERTSQKRVQKPSLRVLGEYCG